MRTGWSWAEETHTFDTYIFEHALHFSNKSRNEVGNHL